MEAQMKVIAYRTQQWVGTIQECRNSGLTNKDWCEQNNVSLSAYYYWLRKIRSETELPAQRFVQVNPVTEPGTGMNAVVIRSGNLRAEIPEGTSSILIESVIAAMRKTC